MSMYLEKQSIKSRKVEEHEREDYAQIFVKHLFLLDIVRQLDFSVYLVYLQFENYPRFFYSRSVKSKICYLAQSEFYIPEM